MNWSKVIATLDMCVAEAQKDMDGADREEQPLIAVVGCILSALAEALRQGLPEEETK